jgi:hypothetical protein
MVTKYKTACAACAHFVGGNCAYGERARAMGPLGGCVSADRDGLGP